MFVSSETYADPDSRIRKEYDMLVTLVRRYLGEYDNPAPDLRMRKEYRDLLRVAVNGTPRHE
jgi:hypothetical protein